jgi:hypothetical protein
MPLYALPVATFFGRIEDAPVRCHGSNALLAPASMAATMLLVMD